MRKLLVTTNRRHPQGVRGPVGVEISHARLANKPLLGAFAFAFDLQIAAALGTRRFDFAAPEPERAMEKP